MILLPHVLAVTSAFPIDIDISDSSADCTSLDHHHHPAASHQQQTSTKSTTNNNLDLDRPFGMDLSVEFGGGPSNRSSIASQVSETDSI